MTIGVGAEGTMAVLGVGAEGTMAVHVFCFFVPRRKILAKFWKKHALSSKQRKLKHVIASNLPNPLAMATKRKQPTETLENPNAKF